MNRVISSFPMILILLIVSFWGVGLSMPTYEGNMTGCPLMGGWGSMCQMDILGHITSWQQLFTAKVNDANTLVLLLLSVLLLLIASQLGIRSKDKTLLDSSFCLYNKTNPQARLFNYLNFLFSKGVLHPKIY